MKHLAILYVLFSLFSIAENSQKGNKQINNVQENSQSAIHGVVQGVGQSHGSVPVVHNIQTE